MREQLKAIREKAASALDSAQARQELEELRVRFLGKKGELTAILKQMGGLSAEERPVIGQLANEVRVSIEERIACRAKALEEAETARRLKAETTLPFPASPFAAGGYIPSTRP